MTLGEIVALAHLNELVRAGLLAPSGDNCQPWRFVWNGQQLEIRFDRERAESLYDIRQAASWVALGAVLTNIRLAANEQGLRTTAALFPDPAAKDVAARLTIEPSRQRRDPLFDAIPVRCVNRRPYAAAALPRDVRETLLATIQEFSGVFMDLVEEPRMKRRLARLAACNDRLVFENRALHNGLFRWIRWNPEETTRTGDGMPVESLELGAGARAGFRWLAAWPFARLISTLGATRLLALKTARTYRRSAAIGLLSVEGHRPEDFVRSGEALEQLWLTAALHRVAFQPITGMTFLWLRCREDRGAGLSRAHQAVIERIGRQLSRLLPAFARHTPVMLFRIGYAEPPMARALRRRVDEVFTATES